MPTAPRIRPLEPADAPAFFALRLEGLEREPGAFGQSADSFRARGVEGVAERLGGGPEGSLVLGLFEGAELLGVAGLGRHAGAKERHKAFLWGVYVAEPARGRGLGRALLEALLARARQDPELEQVQLTVTTVQTAARALYQSLGFVPFGLERRALRVGEDFLDEEHLCLWLRPPAE